MSAIGAPPQAPYEMIGLFALIAGCQLIGPEFSSGTLQLILSKPVGRSTYLALARGRRGAGDLGGGRGHVRAATSSDGSSPERRSRGALRCATALVAALKVLLVCSLLAFLGSFSRSYVNVGIYIGAQILLPMIFGLLGMMKSAVSGEMAEDRRDSARASGHPRGARCDSQQSLSGHIRRIPFDRNWILMMLCNASVALLLACVIFSRREVPYGAD